MEYSNFQDQNTTFTPVSCHYCGRRLNRPKLVYRWNDHFWCGQHYSYAITQYFNTHQKIN